MHAQQAANANATYQTLRTLLPEGETIKVSQLRLVRDAAVFTFDTGTFAFFPDVNGKATGAVFRGEGHFHLTPTDTVEKRNLDLVTQSDTFNEDFDRAVFRFTDGTAAELKKAATGKDAVDEEMVSAAKELRSLQRTKVQENFDLRILEDVLSPAPGGYFLAAMHGKKNPRLIFRIDPHGAADVWPEEVSLLNWSDWGATYPAAFHLATDEERGVGGGDEQNATLRIDHEDLEVTIEKGGFLSGEAKVHLAAQVDGVAVAQFQLYPTLRVSKVETEAGKALDFVQEKKDEDADFGVILEKPLAKGETATIRVTYAGKDVVQNEGGANYYPVARESWYPNSAHGLGDFASYHMVFHVPKGLDLIATGTRVRESNDGKWTTSEWKTDVPLAVVGFNLGRFTMKEGTVPGKAGDNLTIDAYANTTPPDDFAHMEDYEAMGSFNAASMLPVQLSQGEAAAQIYTQYFGDLPFGRVALTQQFACNYGQSWPMLVYLPICGFLDETQQHFAGLHPEDMYWRVVTPHEVAHQWWGQTVGFNSYRDQWMSEGFADTSASIFLQLTRPKPDEFREFWRQQRKLITEKNAMGFRPIDVGPVTMGFRLSSQKTGWNIYQDLVYPKGAYILHMIRMMMWTPQDGDARFMATMHDFLNTYRLKAATTEDFKAMVEKHMSQQMDLTGNHRMDWFFDEYVYGTDLPAYQFEGEVTPNGETSTMHFKLTQEGVPASFRMLVPLYLEFATGKTIRLGSIGMIGNKTVEQTVQLPKLPAAPKKLWINYYYDVLSTED